MRSDKESGLSNKDVDFSKYYNLHDYIFTEVHKKFHENGFIGAFDFFCIIIWKANRAKSKIAVKLKQEYPNKSLDEITKILTHQIYDADGPKEKLRILLGYWNFGLPMASAILTVFYPESFTIYDVRVCSVLKKFENLKNKPESILDDYFEYVKAVKSEVPNKIDLRDKDKFLWGKSFYKDLVDDLKTEFKN